MNKANRYSPRLFGLEILGIVIAIIFAMPFYFVFVNSVKSIREILSNAGSLPTKLELMNYVKSWGIMRFPLMFTNSLFITVISIAGLIIISSMAAYRMVRRPHKLNKFLFVLFVSAMVIPFQAIMIPLVQVAQMFGLMDSRIGLIICYFGFGVSLSMFLYHGFIKSIPKEIEESAVVDGCSPYGVFWRIVFPLLKPMTVTIMLLNSLWIWNDFLLPLLVLHQPGIRTIPLAIYSFFGEYTKQWDMALAGLVMGLVPIVVFFLAMQKSIIEGITAGAVKG